MISAVSNAVIRGTSKPIQAQIMDANTCFEKLWLQSCINSLYENGLDNDLLNLLYIEKKEAEITIKVNNKLTERVKVNDIIMQGSDGQTKQNGDEKPFPILIIMTQKLN